MIPILYQDKYLLVCEKPIGVLSAPESGRRKNMPDMLKKQTGSYIVDVIHRLDQPVGGVMVYSRSGRATPGLYRQFAGHSIIKEYLAVVCGIPSPAGGEWYDLLLKDAVHCRSRVVPEGTRGAKDARLTYRVLQTALFNGQEYSLVKIRLHTGRTHQIRVQFSSRRHPLLGDEKYGTPDSQAKAPALWSYRLCFRHPVTGKTLDTVCPPPHGFPWNGFDPTLFSTAL